MYKGHHCTHYSFPKIVNRSTLYLVLKKLTVLVLLRANGTFASNYPVLNSELVISIVVKHICCCYCKNLYRISDFCTEDILQKICFRPRPLFEFCISSVSTKTNNIIYFNKIFLRGLVLECLCVCQYKIS